MIFIVSPELSSGRDIVIQTSVRRAACGVRRPQSAVHVFFLSGAYLGNRMTYLDDIWYVGGARSEVAYAEFWAWQTLMEVKGHQRSNGVNYVLWLPYLVKRSPTAS